MPRAMPAKSQAGHMLQISQSMKETLLFGRDVSNSDSNLNSTPASTTITTPLLSQAFDGGDGEDTVAYETERHALVYKKHFFS